MKLLRHLGHPPLLIWTFVLVLLLGFGFVGLTTGTTVDRPGVIEPRATNGWSDAQSLLEMLPASNAALAAGTFERWLADFNALATTGAETHVADDKQDLWQQVTGSSQELSALDFEDRAALLDGLERLNSAVFALVRSYR
jgi:uncharacterized membrane protein